MCVCVCVYVCACVHYTCAYTAPTSKSMMNTIHQGIGTAVHFMMLLCSWLDFWICSVARPKLQSISLVITIGNKQMVILLVQNDFVADVTIHRLMKADAVDHTTDLGWGVILGVCQINWNTIHIKYHTLFLSCWSKCNVQKSRDIIDGLEVWEAQMQRNGWTDNEAPRSCKNSNYLCVLHQYKWKRDAIYNA